MSDFYTRLVDEHTELNIKFKALAEYIGHSPNFKSMSEDEQARLNRQFEIMTDYMDVLTERIDHLTEPSITNGSLSG